MKFNFFKFNFVLCDILVEWRFQKNCPKMSLLLLQLLFSKNGAKVRNLHSVESACPYQIPNLDLSDNQKLDLS